ncbi:LytR C-terminal domain-containing protein [Actinacidiphila sp. ITFR-21]|uniref:LytR C-terminal domain-containing protein n=1 Tax=Actinacidiphila sp. ITFR-21 TaxID=3075199 RepID=UPI002889C946|nr:LytR C-terminal domain-containing protein [Streptomyces sp. ITFR-21]WNI16504.1 LytR C-terminal domain-containing protein [Streptomyces sp. ITFR-21]
MSMLTPSGMGGKYRVTGNAYPRMRRPRRRGRILAAVVASVVVLSLFGWGALQLVDVFGGGDGDTKANAAPLDKPSCRPVPAPTRARPLGPLPQPTGVTLNVLNATSRGGLAKTTADALAGRGFKVARFGNAPDGYDQKVTQSALLVAGPAGEAAAREAGTQVAGSTVRIDPHRKDKTVDLLIGNAFATLATPAQAAAARVVAANPPPPKPVCAPVTTPAAKGGARRPGA